MQVDEESSSDESEEEVCGTIGAIYYWFDVLSRVRNSILPDPLNYSRREEQWRSSPSPGWILIIRGRQPGAYEIFSCRLIQSSATSRPAAA
jgi:hypothetical protein